MAVYPIYYEYKGVRTVIRYEYTYKKAIAYVAEANARSKAYTYGIVTK